MRLVALLTLVVAATLAPSATRAQRRASPVDALLSKLKQNGRGVNVGADSGNSAPPHNTRLPPQPQQQQLPPPPPPPPPPRVPPPLVPPTAQQPQATGLDQESLEAEALQEALRAPIIGANGEDRSVPQPREESGAGRKDDVRSTGDGWGGWFSSLLPGAGSNQGPDAAASDAPAEVGTGDTADAAAPHAAGSSAPTGGVADGAAVDGHKVPPPELLSEPLWRKPGDEARSGRGRGRGRASPVSELLKTIQGRGGASTRGTPAAAAEAPRADVAAASHEPDPRVPEQHGQPAQPVVRLAQSDTLARTSSKPSREAKSDALREGTEQEATLEDDGGAAAPDHLAQPSHSDVLPAVTATPSATTDVDTAQQSSETVVPEAVLPELNGTDTADPKVVAMEKLKAFQLAARARVVSSPAPTPQAVDTPEPVRVPFVLFCLPRL
jgi:hypothetical protein